MFTLDLHLAPDLAESWDVSPDGTVYTFHLRPGARFHNGRPVRADDVIYSWDRAADPKTDSVNVLTYLADIVGLPERRNGKAASVAGLRAVDDQTLEVRIDAPKPYFVMKLVYTVAYVLDRANVESGPEWYRTPNGTGPYRLARWEPGVVRIYERSPNFYLGKPAIPYIVEQLFAGSDLRLYETGDLDITGIGGLNLERARDPHGPWPGQLREGVSLCTSFVGIDSSQPPFDDPAVRRAFALAVDRARIAEILRDGVLPAKGLYPPALPGYRADAPGQTYDPAAARRALAASRYKAADQLPRITLTNGGFGSDVSGLDSAMAGMWREVLGVEIQFENIEPNRWEEVMHSGRHGQLFSYGWCADYPDPENFADALFHTGAQQNLGHYSNPELDRTLEAARTERDVGKRIELYQQAEQLLIDDGAAIFYGHSRSFVLVKPRIKGYVLTPMAVPIDQDAPDAVSPGGDGA
jgi:oligopeptide transport system substrate-binding protein